MVGFVEAVRQAKEGKRVYRTEFGDRRRIELYDDDDIGICIEDDCMFILTVSDILSEDWVVE